MLLKQLLLRHGQVRTEEKIFQGGLVQDVVRMQSIAADREVEAEVTRPQPEKLFSAAGKAAEWFARMGEITRGQPADGLDDGELRQLVQLVQLAHALLRKSHLIHGFGQHTRLPGPTPEVADDDHAYPHSHQGSKTTNHGDEETRAGARQTGGSKGKIGRAGPKPRNQGGSLWL